jgi:hypothetical protein
VQRVALIDANIRQGCVHIQHRRVDLPNLPANGLHVGTDVSKMCAHCSSSGGRLVLLSHHFGDASSQTGLGVCETRGEGVQTRRKARKAAAEGTARDPPQVA